MLIPVGHEHTTVRRLPWVSFAIMGLSFLVFVAILVSPPADPRAASRAMQRALRYFSEHPYLELDPRLREVMEREVGRDRLKATLELARQFGAKPPADPEVRRREQEELRRLVDAALAARRRHPFYRWGLVPAHIRPLALITHQFLHAGWLHLLGNLFIFYLCGPFVEDVWGRPLFAIFYLAGGVFAGLMFALRYPHLDVPLVGASGAIAAVMGAFLVRYWKTRIRFFYWFGLVFRGTFEAPAWLMLGLWFGRELFFAQAMDLGGGRSGVAYWAHVWGFAFGVTVAVAIRHFRIEERFVNPAIEEKVTLAANPVIDEAMEAWRREDREGALRRLEVESRRDPGNVDVALAFWNLACQAGTPERAAGAMLAAVRAELRAGEDDLAGEHWLDLARRVPAVAAEPVTAAKALEALDRVGRPDEAREGLGLVVPRLGGTVPPGALARLARMAERLGGAAAVPVLELAAGHPELPAEARAAAREGLAALEPGGAAGAGGREAAPASAPPGVPGAAGASPAGEPSRPAAGPPEAAREPLAPAPVARRLEIVQAVPLELGEHELWLEVRGRGRARLPYEKLQAVAVVGIRPPDGKGFLLLDLLLDPPWGDSPTVRALRISSRSFDPRRLVPDAGSPLEAFRAVVDRILSASQAAPLPSPAAVRGEPFATFATVPAYEEEVLGLASE